MWRELIVLKKAREVVRASLRIENLTLLWHYTFLQIVFSMTHGFFIYQVSFEKCSCSSYAYIELIAVVLGCQKWCQQDSTDLAVDNASEIDIWATGFGRNLIQFYDTVYLTTFHSMKQLWQDDCTLGMLIMPWQSLVLVKTFNDYVEGRRSCLSVDGLTMCFGTNAVY